MNPEIPVKNHRDAAYWRALADAYAPDPGEFPVGADLPPNAWTRREFLRLVAASAALAGVAGCATAPSELIVPYVQQPPGMIPGVASHFATTMTLAGFGTGLVVEAHEGRPTKIEGNPLHPASLGASGVFEQAAILGLYDPDRAATARHGNEPCRWDDFVADFADHAGEGGSGLWVMGASDASPTCAAQLARLRARWPRMHVIDHDPLGQGPRGEAGRALRAVHGRPVVLRHDLRAPVIVALDADPLASGAFHLRQARDFSDGRRARAAGQAMNRLYVAESSPTCTGSLADHRLRLRDHEVDDLVFAIIAELVRVHGLSVPDAQTAARVAGGKPGVDAAWVATVAADLANNAGKSVVMVGERRPAATQRAVHVLNDMLGNLGATVVCLPDPRWLGDGDISELAAALAAGGVGRLLILGGNPVRTAPGDVDFSALIAQAGSACYLGQHEDETARACAWFVPEAHFLECWGDAVALDGTPSLQQPLIEPMYGGHSASEILARLGGDRRGGRELVRDVWRARRPGDDDAAFATWYARCLRDGVAGTAALPIAEPPDWAAPGPDEARFPPDAWEISLHADAKVHDGRFANNPWLQELPDPISKLTWDNAALLSPASALALGVATGDLIAITGGAAEIVIPVVVQPGQADASIRVALGYGRDGAERTAAGVGVDAYRLRVRGARWNPPVSVRRVVGSRALGITQEHWSLEGRPIIRERTAADFAAHPRADAPPTPQPSLRSQSVPAPGPQWGMVVDLSVCTGCSACVIACQAENNIPVVGRDNVRRGREMHWLRVDRYYRGDAANPVALSQPMACQHCEKAPCEYVCPTYATTHSRDGLNEMTYNRCVGTRFCSNNCPYKVRRFNWYEFNDHKARTITLARNPEVTVRARGVMEKCTYCVQRIRGAGNNAAATGVPLATDAIATACQQSCPTRAITFGDITDSRSEVAALRHSPLAYAVLEDTGTQPRTLYLERLANPNPGLA